MLMMIFAILKDFAMYVSAVLLTREENERQKKTVHMQFVSRVTFVLMPSHSIQIPIPSYPNFQIPFRQIPPKDIHSPDYLYWLLRNVTIFWPMALKTVAEGMTVVIQ